MVATVAIAALAGALTGALAGFFVAIAQFQGKRLRNARLMRAGQSGYRDCVLIYWHVPCAILGALASGILAVWLAPITAVALGSLTIPGLLMALFAIGLLHQAWSRTS